MSKRLGRERGKERERRGNGKYRGLEGKRKRESGEREKGGRLGGKGESQYEGLNGTVASGKAREVK